MTPDGPMDTRLTMTPDLPKITGKIRQSSQDFRVEEIPLYEPCGSGTHLYLQIEKQEITTLDVMEMIAKRLGVARRQIGYAGLKDAHAVTRQWLSIEHQPPQALERLQIPGLRIIQSRMHRNKLRLGHLSANRFEIRIRHIEEPPRAALTRTLAILDVLQRQGMPNAYGPQRFGMRQNAHLVGRAICQQDAVGCLDLLLGLPLPSDPETFAQARRYYDQGEYEQAHQTWPNPFREERYLLRELIRNQGKKGRTYRKLNRTLKRFYISAFQSHIFNRVLEARMPHLAALLTGDMAYKHDNGACFSVTDAALEQPRSDRFEISPTGPMFGKRLSRLTGPAADIEDPILFQEAGDILNNPDLLRNEDLKGSRRPLRVQPQHVKALTGQDEQGDFLQINFDLPPGSYATVLLAEILKPDQENPLR